MKPKKSVLCHAGLTCSSFVLALTAPALHAADGTYSSQTGAWNVAGSWTGSVIASGTDSTAFFTNDVTTQTRTTSLGADRTIGNIVFTDSNNTTGNGFNRIISNNILTLDVTSGKPTINVTQSGRQLTFGSQLSGNDGLSLTGPGLVQFSNSGNDYSGGTEINAGTLLLAASGTAGSGTIYLGNTTGSANVELRMSATGTNISNDLEVRTGSSGTRTLANRSSNSVTYSGIITANDNLTILGANSGGGFTINNAGNSVASGKTVSFVNTGTGASSVTESALWSGDGALSYTSSTAKGFTVSGAKTYTGGATLGAMSGDGILIATASSVFTGPTLTSGAFGTGTLSIGATKMRGGNTNPLTIGNAITFIDNPTFTTVASEKSIIFTGDASLGATRTLTVETGSTVSTEGVEFSGAISGTGFGIIKEGAGNLRLSGTNSYTGATTVNAGTLEITSTGSTDAASAVTVSNPGTALVVNGTINGTLVANVSTVVSGTGSVAGAASVAGALNPGNSPGVLGFESDLTMAGSTATIMEINGAVRGTDYDGIDVGGTLTYEGTLTIDIGAIFAPGSYSWNLFDMTSETGTFSTVSVIGEYSGSLLDGDLDGVWDFSDPDNTWQFTESTGTLSLVTVVPEPGAALLGGLGLLALLRRRR